MTIIEHTPAQDEILDFIDSSLRQLQAGELEPKYILVGPEAYRRLRKAIGARFRRGAGTFETYQYLPIVVDPFRSEEVCVLPSAAACAEGARGYRTRDQA